MTQAQARQQLRAVGYVLRVVEGEVQTKPRGDAWDGPSTVYASDLEDAVGTATADAARARSSCGHCYAETRSDGSTRPHAETCPEREASDAVAVELRGRLTLYGRSSQQVQTATAHYVVTQVERGAFIYLAQHDERFLVDRAACRLRRLEWAGQRVRVDRLKPIIGDIRVETTPASESDADRAAAAAVGAFDPFRHTYSNGGGRVTVEGSALSGRVGMIGRTALAAERAFDARDQPFSLDLPADAVVIRSELRTVAADFEQRQVYTLEKVSTTGQDTAEFDRWARWAII